MSFSETRVKRREVEEAEILARRALKKRSPSAITQEPEALRVRHYETMNTQQGLLALHSEFMRHGH